MKIALSIVVLAVLLVIFLKVDESPNITAKLKKKAQLMVQNKPLLNEEKSIFTELAKIAPLYLKANSPSSQSNASKQTIPFQITTVDYNNGLEEGQYRIILNSDTSADENNHIEENEHNIPNLELKEGQSRIFLSDSSLENELSQNEVTDPYFFQPGQSRIFLNNQ